MTTIKDYLLENYEMQTIKEITQHGCISGICSDLIYYNDTCKFHDKHEQEIWDLLDQNAQASDCSIIQLIEQFKGQKDVGSMTQFKNLLTWYAVEEIAYQIIEESENNSND